MKPEVEYVTVFGVIQQMTSMALENARFVEVVVERSEVEAILYFQGEYLFCDVITRWLTQHMVHDPKEVVKRVLNEGRFVSLVGRRVVKAVRKIKEQHTVREKECKE